MKKKEHFNVKKDERNDSINKIANSIHLYFVWSSMEFVEFIKHFFFYIHSNFLAIVGREECEFTEYKSFQNETKNKRSAMIKKKALIKIREYILQEVE